MLGGLGWDPEIWQEEVAAQASRVPLPRRFLPLVTPGNSSPCEARSPAVSGVAAASSVQTVPGSQAGSQARTSL